MPTISQLPASSIVSAADEMPISQGGKAQAVSVGALLASTQPAIIVDSPSLIGRTSLGSGGPEQVDVGTGISFADGTLVANGLDHAIFPHLTNLVIQSDLVISNQGSPMLMQASLLRSLFSAGRNVAIDSNGTISATASTTTTGGMASTISGMRIVGGLTSQDLVGASQSGSDCAISYSNLLGGVTIDEAPAAGPVGDTDTVWAAQGSNIMASQNFGAIWGWIANKLPGYRNPVIEIATNTSLDGNAHNGRTIICSQALVLTPSVSSMGSGFHCNVINGSAATVTLGSGFVTSNGGLILAPWQSASVSCLSYSGGTIAFASMAGTTTTSIAVPGQVSSLFSSATASTTITLGWQSPSTGGIVSSYLLQYRISGTTSWINSQVIVGSTNYQLTGLQAGTTYDVTVAAQSATGVGAASTVLTVSTSSALPTGVPAQVTGLAANPTSNSAVTLTWSPQTGVSAAVTFTVQSRPSGSSSWTSSVPGVSGTTYSFSSLVAATSYEFSVFGTNAVGSGSISATATATTFAAAQSVVSITWNLGPSGTYTHGNGSIGLNAHVNPGESPIRFGFSPSPSVLPTSWTAAILVNTDLWGAYAPTPSATGSWYAWAEGLDGSAPTISSSPFLVQ